VLTTPAYVRAPGIGTARATATTPIIPVGPRVQRAAPLLRPWGKRIIRTPAETASVRPGASVTTEIDPEDGGSRADGNTRPRRYHHAPDVSRYRFHI
jgi:hypothetical protein